MPVVGFMISGSPGPLRQQIARRHVGDGIMALFGAPTPRMIGPIAPGCELLKELVLGTAPIAVLATRDDLSGQLELRALQPITSPAVEKWDESKFKAYPAGTFYSEPPKASHYSWAKDGEVILQITGIGPSGKTFIPQQ